jgi:hypothetical protein
MSYGQLFIHIETITQLHYLISRPPEGAARAGFRGRSITLNHEPADALAVHSMVPPNGWHRKTTEQE